MARSALRQEYIRLKTSGEIARRCGTRCVCCKSDQNVEYHHVVPLSLGGNNEFSNIVPLCHRCHLASHNGRHIQSFADHSNDTGRPPKCDDDTAFKALDLLAAGEIGNRKCQELMSLGVRTMPNATRQFTKWAELRGYKKVRNNLDVRITNRCGVRDGEEIGHIELLDGTKAPILFHDTGLNDDVQYRFRGDRSGVPITFAQIKWNESKGRGAKPTAHTPKPHKCMVEKEKRVHQVAPMPKPREDGPAWWAAYKQRYAEDVG